MLFGDEVWKSGFDMKDKSDVRDLREDHASEHIPKSVERFAKLAQNAVCEAGSYFVQQRGETY